MAGDQQRARERDGDDTLIARTAGGDERAFAELIARHGDRIAALARHLLGPAADTDDIVQESFLRLWTQAPAWRPGGAQVSTWLYRVASNLCIDRLRKPAATALDTIAEPADPRPRPDQDHAASRAAMRVEAALQQLPPRQRMALVLCHFEELSNIEASELMGITVEALESLLARGRRTLRHALEDERAWLIAALRDGGMEAGREIRHG